MRDHFIRINAMTYLDLLKAVDYGSDQRSRECTPNLYKFDENGGVLDFVTRCSRSKNSWYQRIVLSDWGLIQEMLLDTEPEEEVAEEPEVIEEKVEENKVEKKVEEEVEEEEVEEVADESLKTDEELEEGEKQASIKRYARDWNEVKSLVPEVLESDIKVFCNCPAFLYWGSKYILTELDSAVESEGRFPGVRDPDLSHTLCKHLIAVLRRFFK